jgi:hypothetical protein
MSATPIPHLRVRLHADGRRSFPEVVRYRLFLPGPAGGYVATDEVLELPPLVATHPDPSQAAGRIAPGASRQPCSLPYRVEVLDQEVYRALWRRGWLWAGHGSLPVPLNGGRA